MIGSRIPDDGLHASAVAEVIELFGGYIVARHIFFGRPALQDFMRVFKALIVIVILLASLEPLARTSSLFHTPVNETQLRGGIARAQSTIEDAELFGTLCCVAAALFIYMEPNGVREYLRVGFCFFGCLLAISAGPLLTFVIVIATYVYDQKLRRISWRWKAYVATVAAFITVVSLVVKHPISWFVPSPDA